MVIDLTDAPVVGDDDRAWAAGTVDAVAAGRAARAAQTHADTHADTDGATDGAADGAGHLPAPVRIRRPGRSMWRVAWLVLAGVVVLAGLVVSFPLRTWYAQRNDIREVEARLVEIRSRNAQLNDRLIALQQDDAAIEQAARERYGMAFPHERVYAVLPAPATGQLPTGFPYDTLAQWVRRG
jgi:cell division protein FtsB